MASATTAIAPATVTKKVFDIRPYSNQLTPTGRNRYQCPICNGKNLTFDFDNYQGYTCWNNDTEQHRAAIRECLAPWAKRQKHRTNIAPKPGADRFQKPIKRPQKQVAAPVPLPEPLVLARLAQPATNSPQPQERANRIHGSVLVWRFPYSERQWVERVQWVDSTKEKGYDKDYFPYFVAIGGEQVPLKRKGKTVGHRSATPGEVVCGRGAEDWQPYRFEEAIAAAKTSGANTLLVTEGENCVELYRQLGLATVTLPGAGWSGEAITALVQQLQAAGLAIACHPDHDKSGYDKAAKLRAAAAAAGVPYLQLEPTAIDPGIEAHADVANLVGALGQEEFLGRLEAEIHRQVELRQSGGNGKPPGGNGSGGDGGNSGGDNPQPDDLDNPDAPFREICAELGLPFEYCVTRQQFDGSTYRVLFGGEQGDWVVLNSAFYRWNGSYWEYKTDSQIHKLIADYGQQAFKISFDSAGKPYFVRPYENNKHKESAFKYCRSRLEEEVLTTNAHLLGFNDGVVDLRTGQFMPHDKSYLLTNVIPHNYTPNSECPKIFEEFVVESFGEEMLVPIRAFTSAFLDPTAPYGRFPHLLGKSGGGKGTLGRFWSSLFGTEGAGSASNFSDLSTPEGRHQYLTGKRIFAFPDVGGYSQGLRAFYELVDNGSMTGRALFSPVAYSKLWNCRFWLASVDHLQVENAGDGWARRAYLLPVRERNVTPDPNLKNKLEAVKAQVISWALAMPRVERDAILLAPPASERAKSLALDAALYGDSTRSFIDLCLRPSAAAEATVSHNQLHSWYVVYCQQHGYTPLGQSKFIAHLRTVLPRNYVDRGWSPMVRGERSRVPAHWRGIIPLTGVFHSSISTEFDNPLWTCTKRNCTEGGLEEFEQFWNPSADPLPKPLETSEVLHTAGVQFVQEGDIAKGGVDRLEALQDAVVQGGSTVQSERFSLTFAEVAAMADEIKLDELTLDLQPCPNSNGQCGQPHVERVSGTSTEVDSLDNVDSLPLPLDALQRALQVMLAIDSIESFQQFYDRYQHCSKTQQQQILDAFTAQADLDSQTRFYQCWQTFEEVSTLPEEEAQIQVVQQELECCFNVADYRQVVQRYGQAIVDAASERLTDEDKATVDRIAHFLQKNHYI
ncbi:hypothetical protein IFO70_30040 [Phormidium tenue FACHB-886]|nr:hypothetical protein [Phormidium tenue FACHB-886]